MLIIRELAYGSRRFSELKSDLPGISANVLTQRLTELEERGLVVRKRLPPPASVQVYEATPWALEATQTVSLKSSSTTSWTSWRSRAVSAHSGACGLAATWLVASSSVTNNANPLMTTSGSIDIRGGEVPPIDGYHKESSTGVVDR